MVTQPSRVPIEKPLKWASVNIQEVIDSGFRLKAGTYGIESRQIRKDLETLWMGYRSFRNFYYRRFFTVVVQKEFILTKTIKMLSVF